MKKPNYPYHHAAAMYEWYEHLLSISTNRKQRDVLSQGLIVWMEELKAHKNLKQN